MEKEELIKQVENWKKDVEKLFDKALKFEQISPIGKTLLDASLMKLQGILDGKTIKGQFNKAIGKEKEGKHE